MVCAGPLTNVAAALRHAPDIATRMTLAWVGGSLDGSAEYNRDTDPGAAEQVMSTPGLARWTYPLETYRRCAWSVAALEDLLTDSGALGAWLWRRFEELPLPDGFEVDAVWPLGDSCPLIGTALSDASSRWTDAPGSGSRTCTRIDDRLLFDDLRAVLRRHARRAALPT